MKRKLLLMMASLLLAGAVSAQTNYWGNDPNSHAQPSNTPIVASVQIDGTAVTATDAMRLGAFVGNDLRGIAAKHTDGKFWIQVFYTAQTDNITFKFYDGETEYTTCETTLNGEAVTLTGLDEGYGTPATPVVLNFTTTQTQEIALVSGWNWWSTNIELEGNDGLQQLKDELGTACVKIKSRTDGNLELRIINGNMYWLGQLSAIHNEQMYMIQTNAACDVEITGQQRALPANHPISIINGWNWIGFPSNQSVNLANAFCSDFIPANGDKIKGRAGSAEYYASVNRWLGTLSTLEPGNGYMYLSKSQDPKTLVYQAGRQEIVDNIVFNDLIFHPEIDKYAYNMTITAIVELEGKELRSDDYEIAAFVGNECRGSVKLMYLEPIDRYMAFILVFGDKEENLRFALTDGKEISWSSDQVLYSENGDAGTISEPAVLHFGPLGVDESGLTFVSVYPNPSKGMYTIESADMRKIEIFNAYGQIIYSKEVKEDNIQIDLSNHAVGTYLLRVVTDNGVMIKKLIKE